MTILSVETSTQVCSAALLTDGTVADERISYNGGNHAELLPEYVDSLLRLCGKIDAVALSAGPQLHGSANRHQSVQGSCLRSKHTDGGRSDTGYTDRSVA